MSVQAQTIIDCQPNRPGSCPNNLKRPKAQKMHSFYPNKAIQEEIDLIKARLKYQGVPEILLSAGGTDEQEVLQHYRSMLVIGKTLYWTTSSGKTETIDLSKYPQNLKKDSGTNRNNFQVIG